MTYTARMEAKIQHYIACVCVTELVVSHALSSHSLHQEQTECEP